MKFFLAFMALFLCATVDAQTPYTLNLADGTTTVASPRRAGINLASLNYYDNGQVYKNLLAQDNFGFENTLSQQIWALKQSGTATTFCNTNAYAVYPVNFWAGATVSVVESDGPEAGYTGTIASNTAGGPACYTVASPAPAAFSAGDEVIITLNQFPTAESCWETSTNCGVWTNISNGGRLLTDSTTPYDGKQSLILDVTAGTSATAGVSLYFDSDSQNRFVVLNGTYEIKGWMKTGSVAANHLLTLCAGRTGTQQCQNVTPTSQWSPFSISVSMSETNTTPNSALVMAFIAGANGLGQVEIDDLSFTKTSGQDPTNTSVFRDEFVNALRQYCATETTGPSCLIRNWTNQNGETMSNWTATQSAALQTIAGAGAPTYGEITPRLLDYLNLVKLVGGIPYFVEPVTFQGSDPANLVEYLSSTNTGSGYGQIRANQGQTAPWVGPGGVFSDAYVSFCNECWNDSSFSGQALPWRSAEATDYYHDYWNRAKDVFAAMRADSAFNSGIHLGFNLQLGVNYRPGGLDKALRGMAAVNGAADYVEQAPYEQSTVSSWQSDSALWGSALEQPWDDAANPLSPSGYHQAVQAIQSYKLCGATGKEACEATNYEQANNTLTTCGVAGWPACTGGANQAIDQAHEDMITAGAGEGIIAPLQMALNQQLLGVTAQNYFGATEFSNGTLYGSTAQISKLWGICVDYGGATSYVNGESYSCRPQFLGISILNQAIIGPEYACTLASGPTYIWPGSALNGPTGAWVGVPYVYPFCFKGGDANGNQRSIVLINTNLTQSYTIQFAGTNAPSGTCQQQQYAPSSPDLLNEAPSKTNTSTTAATTKIASSSVSCGSTITLPPDSETAISYTIGGVAPTATPTFSPAGGNYSEAQTVTIADSTAGAKIYYTVNGSAPTSSSTAYTGAIHVSASETLHAVAIAPGHGESSEGAATYSFSPKTSAAPSVPVFSVPAGTYDAAQTVSIRVSTAGATAYYTTNGSTPTASSTKYTVPVTVKVSETLRAVAVSSSGASKVASAAYVIEPATATPTFKPGAGSYSAAQSVTLTDATAGAKIYYTINGATPTSKSTLYSGAIKVGSSETLRAIAIASGHGESGEGTAIYSIAVQPSGVPSTPVLSVAGGTYASAQTVKISDATAGATIHYTTNGSTPTASSTKYTVPVTVKVSETLRAVAVDSKGSSKVASASYVIEPATATPTFKPGAGSYSAAQSVTIADATAGAKIYYTVNGATPTSKSTVYSGAIKVKSSETLRAVAIASKHGESAEETAAYHIGAQPSDVASAPVFSLPGGTYAAWQKVSIRDATAGATIHFTTNGTTPTAKSPVYSSPLLVSESETLRAVAITATSTSNVAAVSYVLKLEPVVATPTMVQPAGVYTAAVNVQIGDTTPEAVIHYTLDGTTPTSSSPIYSGYVTVSKTATLKAIAVKAGFANSELASGTYRIEPPAALPTLSLGSGTYTGAQTLSISDATSGAVIYYTTNQSTPTTSSTRYTGPFKVTGSEYVQAIAVAPNMSPSFIAAANINITQ